MTRPGGMRRTTWTDLVLPFVVVAGVVYLLLRFSYDSLPPLGFIVPVPLAVLAVVEGVLARRVRAAVAHDPDAKPMAAIVIARCVALGKASALVGAGVAGAAVGLVLRVLPDIGTVSAADHDATVGGLLLLAAILVTVAGIVLERSGIDPGSETRRLSGTN